MEVWTHLFFTLLGYIGIAAGLTVTVQRINEDVAHLRTEIRREDLDTGSTYNDITERNALQNTPDESDIPGLIIPQRLGGHGNETLNVVPFSRVAYRNWKKVEDILYNFVDDDGTVICQIFVMFNGSRPRGFAVIAHTEDELSTRSTTYRVYKAFVSNLRKDDYWDNVPEEVSLTYTEPYEKLAAPIRHCARGYETRVEYLRALVDNKAYLTRGTNVTEESHKYARTIGTVGDVACALLSDVLGGPGNETHNLTPMAAITAHRWASSQRRLAKFVYNGYQLDLKIWLIYGDPKNTRSSVIVGLSTVRNNDGEYYHQSIYLLPTPVITEFARPLSPFSPATLTSGCMLPLNLNGTVYKLQRDRNLHVYEKDKQVLAEEWSVLVYSCEEGFTFPEVEGLKYNSRSVCKKGKWTRTHKCIRIPRDGECALPRTPSNTSYIVDGCLGNDETDKCKSVEGTIVRQFTSLNYTCAPGYAHPRQNNKPITRSFCLKGSWYPPYLKCLKTCEPMSTETIETECEFEGKSVTCDKPAHQGTILRPKCKPFYRPQKRVTAYTETHCTKNGKWGYKLFKCIPDCGLVVGNEGLQEENSITQAKQPLTFRIVNGTDSEPFEAPWHAGLFRFNEETSNFTYFCGGTIVSPHFILTAAHCVYDPITHQNMFAEDIQVVVGKRKLSWEEENSLEQRISVGQIHTMELYKGSTNFYMHDASLLELVHMITLTSVTIPVCIDWLRDGKYVNGTVGSIVGFGKDETAETISVLKSARLPYIDYNTCYYRAPTGFHPYLHNDKFCAGSDIERGPSPQQGDSGGGFTFVRGNRHFLYGILSSRPLSSDRFAVYTNVSVHLFWLHHRLNQKEFGTEAYVRSAWVF